MSAAHLGHGVGLRHVHYGALLEEGARGAAWFEAISENYFTPGGRPWAVLERLRREVPVVLHGVALGVGSADALDEGYLRNLERVIERVEPAWVSDHLCWSSYEGRYTHDLLPLAYSDEALAHVVDKVARVQERLGRRILLENVSAYCTFEESTIPEAEFLREVCRRTGCGVLLDVNNVIVCQRNLGVDPRAYLETLEIGSVGQIHLAGHTDYGDHVIDTHVGPVPDPVWDLYRQAVRRFGAIPTLVEWDEDVPAYEVLLDEARRAERTEREVLQEIRSPGRTPAGEPSERKLVASAA